MKKVSLIILVLFVWGCIPVAVAPRFKRHDYKIMQAKKFQKDLPREIAFIFKDPKEAEEFYHYINKKYQLQHNNVGYNVPFQLQNQTLYLSYHETQRTDKKINVPLAAIDSKRKSNGNSALFEGHYVSRTGHWYLALTVYDNNIKNCLKENHPLRAETIAYLKALKAEYLSTYNYEELLLNKKS
ncbi:hypothetical protein [Winogradskyella rapida]|uniref:Lipoprotein n=1 Tax=Winogradskyella rapida TaxID=549701 RepID=A0ABW3KN79_9FLAO